MSLELRPSQMREDTIEDSDKNTRVMTEKNPNENKIRFDTAGVERMIIDDSGNVGIGTTSPTNTFHAYSTNTIGFKFEGDDHCIVKIDGSNGAEKTIRFTENDAMRWMMGMDNSPNSQDDCFTIKSDNNNENQQPEFLIDEGTGNVGFGTGIPTSKLDINSDSIRLRTAKTPSSASDTGVQGQVCWDADYVYVCTATDTWKRAALSTW
tara:strand:- start:1288 stop:1911 length:624 start_codon:yes stop_codon:yes gene_type:complete